LARHKVVPSMSVVPIFALSDSCSRESAETEITRRSPSCSNKVRRIPPPSNVRCDRRATCPAGLSETFHSPAAADIGAVAQVDERAVGVRLSATLAVGDLQLQNSVLPPCCHIPSASAFTAFLSVLPLAPLASRLTLRCNHQPSCR